MVKTSVKTLDIYVSQYYGNYEKVESLVLDINPTNENEFEYYSKELTQYFYQYYEIKDPITKQQYIIPLEEFKLILSEDTYYLGSYRDLNLSPNRVKFVQSNTRIKYFTDICN